MVLDGEEVSSTLYCGDCLEILPMLDDNSVDAVITDFPFAYSSNKWDVSAESVEALVGQCIVEFSRLITRDGSLFMMLGPNSVARAVICAEEQGFSLVNWIVWRFDLGYHSKSRFKSRAYHIPWMCRGSWTFNTDDVRIPHRTVDKRNNPNGAVPSDVWTDISEPRKNSKEYAGHKGQKPLSLLLRIVSAATNVNDTILDPFMGSGTTGVACANTNRDFIGIEINSEYYEIAKARIAHAEMQPSQLEMSID